MASVEEVLKKLKAKARPDQLEGMARYGMVVEERLGVSVPEIRQIARETGKDHQLAPEPCASMIRSFSILPL
jgi:3-methyladenine DNA glycosylase AlkD